MSLRFRCRIPVAPFYPRVTLFCVSAIFTLAWGAPPSLIPLPPILAEANLHLNARRYSAAVPLLDQALARAEDGESLPPNLSLERLRLVAVNAHFQNRSFATAQEIAYRLLKSRPSESLLPEARLLLGLSLVAQNQFAEALPVFTDLAESAPHRNKALLYQALAAREAGQIDLAIQAYNRLLASAPRDGDWADSALCLISLYLQQKNLLQASQGLALLRSSIQSVDNIAGLNALSLQLGDALLDAGEAKNALAAYHTVTLREATLQLQSQRNHQMEIAINRATAISTHPTALDALRRLEIRLTQAKTALAAIQAQPHYDAALLYRTGVAFQNNDQPWEAALLFQRLIDRYPDAPERESSFLALIKSHAAANRPDRIAEIVQLFFTEYPQSELVPTAFSIAAQAAAERGDTVAMLGFLQTAIHHFPTSPLCESLMIMEANALFGAGHFDEAHLSAERLTTAHPQGRYCEDAFYLRAMATLVSGQPERALQEIAVYRQRFPEGRFTADARYRTATAEFALGDLEKAETDIAQWLDDFPHDHSQRGEALALQADIAAALGYPEEALSSYHLALEQSLSDDQLGYVLDELTQLHQTRREFDEAVTLWENFVRDRPDHPYVINAAYWIGRLRTQQGRPDEALTATCQIARQHLDDPARDSVERLLQQIAQLLARPPSPGPDGLRPPPTSDEALAQQVETLLLGPDSTTPSPTARARVLFVRAETAALRKNPESRSALLREIASYPPTVLPPGVLGCVGDQLRADGDAAGARNFYQYLVSNYANSWFADFGYVGLGELCLTESDPQLALTHFTDAIDRAGARFKLREATLGRARALLALDRLDAARELFEQVAANRDWRGEATAESVFSLGEILARRGGPENLAQAQAHFQRVYLSYRKFSAWVARAYLRSGETFEQLGQPQEALSTYREFLRDAKLTSLPEARPIRERAAQLESGGA